MDNLLTIQEISRRSGVAASALRFYEARGLIRSERSGAGHRRFPAICAAASRSSSSLSVPGLSLDEIGKRSPSCP
jgi:MerR family redox-sensitive transcriptional activator SoxR